MATMQLPVYGGSSSLIDDELFDCDIDFTLPDNLVIPVRISQCSWHLTKTDRGSRYVAACRKRKVDGLWKTITIKLHRLIAGALPFQIVDHINRNPFDNRRSNLRIVTSSENTINSSHRGGSSRFRGVSFHVNNKRWQSSIQADGRSKYIGSFADEISAARAYDAAAVQLFGEFAVLNFPACEVSQ